MKKEDENVLNALADLGTNDIMSLIEKGRNKEAIIIGVKMGLTKEDVKKTIKEYKESTKKWLHISIKMFTVTYMHIRVILNCYTKSLEKIIPLFWNS